MKNIKALLLTLILGILTVTPTEAQNDSLPQVFLIGEHEEEYSSMTMDYKDLLLSVCNNSMDDAYENWMDLQIQMEEYADSIDYDIKGVKIWVNIFWNKNGKLDYIVYYPKPNSRNMDFDKFTEFLNAFIPTYQSTLTHMKNYSHYGSASFPSSPKTLGKG